MKQIIFTLLFSWVLITSNAIAEKIDCTQFDKVSAKYLECSAKNLKEKSSELKLKAAVGAEGLKEKASGIKKIGDTCPPKAERSLKDILCKEAK